MKDPRWVLRKTVLSLHQRLLSEFGGATGVRDQGMLEPALARPENQHLYENPSVFDLAASYSFGLVRNHPFIDGNKRIGFATGVLFLRINGYRFSATEAQAVIRTLALAAGALDEAGYACWLQSHSRP